MKKYLLFLSSVAMLFASCTKEQVADVNGEGTQMVSFTVGVLSEETKAVADGDGAAANVNHWIMQVLDSDGEVYNYQEKDETAGVTTQTFNVPLIKGQTYQVLFWADTKENYVVTDLRNVTRGEAVALSANRDDLDAFSAVVKDFTTTVATQQNITLKRPFAQLNVVFTDLNKLFETMQNADEYLKFKPVNFVAKVKVPTTFNVLTQEAGTPAATALEMNAPTDYLGNYTTHRAKETLYMDYILASAGSKDIVDIDFSFVSKGVTIAHNFTSIPFQRNYRTNIIGEFMSAGAQWNVEIDPTWSGEHDMTYVTEGSVAAAINALKAGKTAIEITAPEDYDTPVAIPAEANGKDISIKVTGVQGKEMSFTVAEGAQGPANLYLTSDAKDIVINCPSTHVELNGGTYDNVTATTSSTTLVVGKDVTIENLTINGGNAAIYGLVNTINKQASTIVDFYVGTADGLRNVAEKISAAPQGKDFYGKIYLTSDIDLCNVEWTPIAAFQKPLYIDGQGYTIKNLKISESTADYIGFVGTACGLTVKNLNFDTVTLSYPSTVGEEARGGVIAGHVWGATVENCIVKNVDITACQKVGGLIGYIEGDTNVPHTIKNCSVENVSIKSNDPAKILQHGAGGFIGHISLNQNPLISISGCSIKDITIADYGTADYTSSDLQRVPHVFIGNVCNNYSGDDASINTHSVVLENNTISGTNTVLPTCIYSSNYFGWAGNAEERPAWKGGIYIDGQAWTPNYPIKNVTKGIGYTTLEKAVTDAAAGDEITLENGEYTLPDLSDITIIGIGNNVVVNHSSNSICKTTNATIKNIIFNLGQNGYHGFQHASNLVLDGCIINGFMTTYGSTTYKNCTFNQDGYAYNMNAYGAEILCENCVFNGKGKAVYVYNEGNNDMYHISFEDCVFNEVVGEGTKCKAAILVKENYDNQKYVVNINNCHANFDKYIPDDPDMTGSSLWNMEIITTVTGTDVTVYLNNEKVYPFTKFKVSDAEGLRNAVKMFNKGKENTEYTIELADGTYNVSDLHIKQASGENKDPRSLLVKATNKGKVVITPNSDTKTHMIFIVSGCSNYYGSEYITFDGLKFSMTTNPNTGSHAIYCPREPAKDPIGKLLGEEVSRYAHNINILNCELQGFGTADNSLLNAPQAAGINHVKVDGCIINNAGYVVNGYFVDTKVLNSKISNVKACANTNSQGITVENCEISAWNDYCIRSNGGPIIVKNNKFNLTFNGEIKADEPAAVVYLRGANNPLEANISGNTITKAKAEMWDCYCATAWTVNDDAKTAGTGINF